MTKSELTLSAGECGFYPGVPGMYVERDFQFTTPQNVSFWVPAGFWYNGASIPAAFWQVTFSPFDPRIIEAACIHDYLYTARNLSREHADETLFAYIVRAGGGTVRAKMVKAAVRAFGGFAWRESVTDANYRTVLRAQIAAAGKPLQLYGL